MIFFLVSYNQVILHYHLTFIRIAFLNDFYRVYNLSPDSFNVTLLLKKNWIQSLKKKNCPLIFFWLWYRWYFLGMLVPFKDILKWRSQCEKFYTFPNLDQKKFKYGHFPRSISSEWRKYIWLGEAQIFKKSKIFNLILQKTKSFLPPTTNVTNLMVLCHLIIVAFFSWFWRIFFYQINFLLFVYWFFKTNDIKTVPILLWNLFKNFTKKFMKISNKTFNKAKSNEVVTSSYAYS